jgi:hypothetical protein
MEVIPASPLNLDSLLSGKCVHDWQQRSELLPAGATNQLMRERPPSDQWQLMVKPRENQ